MPITLEKYSRGNRFTCPACGKSKTFTRYIDTDTREYIADHVGRCDREDNCGYHYKPSDFRKDGGKLPKKELSKVNIDIPVVLIQESFWLQTQKILHQEENLCKWMLDYFGGDAMVLDVFKKYRIGVLEKFDTNAIVFWYISSDYKYYAGKIMAYSGEGKRIKGIISSVHAELSKLKLIESEYVIKQCFFGSHLLSERPSAPVMIVESEKTALWGAIKWSEYIWLAAGSLNGLSPAKIRQLQGRNVVLIPDIGKGVEVWKNKAEEIKAYAASVTVSELILKNNIPAMAGLDIVDLFLMKNENK